MDLRYKNLRIRNAGAADAQQLAAWWNDGAVMAHAGFPNGLGTTAQEVAKQLAGDTDDTCRRLLIEAGGAPVGEMVYRNLGGGTAEIGVKICDAAHQNRGLGKVLLSMLAAALFDDLHYRKIVLDTNVNNLRAQHVYERLGFQKQRVRENAWTDQLGQVQSAVDYELTEEHFIRFYE